MLLGAAHVFAGAELPHLTLGFAALFLLISLFAHAAFLWRRVTFGMVSVGTLMAVWYLSGLAGNLFQARTEFLALCAAGGLWMTGYVLAASPRQLFRLWDAFIWIAMLIALFQLIAYITAFNASPGSEYLRLRAGFGSPNTAATFFAVLLLVGTGRMLHIVHHPKRPVTSRQDLIDQTLREAFPSLLLVLLAGACLVLTASRAGFVLGLSLATVFIGTEFLVYRKRNGRSALGSASWIGGSVALAMLLISALLMSEILNNRAVELAADARGRATFFAIYLDAWREAPLFGHGLGSFNRVNDAAMTLDNVAALLRNGAAHNVILQWLIQLGLVGLAFGAMVVGAMVFAIGRALWIGEAGPRVFLRMTLFISLLVLVHAQVDFALEIPSIAWTWSLFLGLACGRAGVVRS